MVHSMLAFQGSKRFSERLKGKSLVATKNNYIYYLRDTDSFVHLYGKIQSPRSIVKVSYIDRGLCIFSLQIARNSQYPVYYLATEFLLLFATPLKPFFT